MPLKVLTTLDHARTQYYHFKAIIIAGMGLFTDAYDLFSVIPVMQLIGRAYYPVHGEKPGAVNPAIISTVIAVTLTGTVLGQLVFGVLGDRIGRRRVYGLSLLLMVLSSFASGFSICRSRECMLTSLCFFRFWVGVGIGGDYPLSATIMSEFANQRTRGSFIAAVFSMQGFGILASSAVTMVLAKAFEWASWKGEFKTTVAPEAVNVLWRVILMIGAIPAALTFYWRMGMPETARFTALVERDVSRANRDIARVLGDIDLQTIPEDSEPNFVRTPQTYGLFSKEFLKRHGCDLFACSVSWFIVDIPFYSSTLFQSKIYKSWFKPPEHVNPFQEALDVAKSQAIVAIASTIPGYFATVYFIDRIGRRKIQMMGFLFMAIFLFVLGGAYDDYWYDHTKNGMFMVLYGLTFFFSNFGPNATTFIVPAELFPARLRSTCHGISGAFGKIGAIIGSVGFLWASQDKEKSRVDDGYERGIGMMNSLVILGGVCLVGFGITYFLIPETIGSSLEENEWKEDEDIGADELQYHANRVSL